MARRSRATARVYDLPGGHSVRVTNGLDVSGPMNWSPDGTWIVASATRDNLLTLVRVSAMGGDPIWLTDGGGHETSGSTHGELIFFRRETRGGVFDLLTVPLDGSSSAAAIHSDVSSAGVPQISPDGRWIAYDSSEAGAHQIYVRPYPDVRARLRVARPGWSPRWSRDGTRLFYRRIDEIRVVPVEASGSDVHIGTPALVVRHPGLGRRTWGNPVQLSADKRRFLFVALSPHDRQLVYVPRWADEFRNNGEQ